MTTDQNSGRVAVITGASSGIGEATARAPLMATASRFWRAERTESRLCDGETRIRPPVERRHGRARSRRVVEIGKRAQPDTRLLERGTHSRIAQRLHLELALMSVG
jgi:hypothetical protein